MRDGSWLQLSCNNKVRSAWAFTWMRRRWPATVAKLFRYMHLSPWEVRAMYCMFARADRLRRGELAVAALIKSLGIEHSDFANRVFCMMEHVKGIRLSGRCDFVSFVISLWSICSLAKEEVATYCFQLYVIEGSEILDEAEFKTLLIDVSTLEYSGSDAVIRTVQDMRTLAAGGIGKKDFAEFCRDRPLFLAPAHQLRVRARRAFGGDPFWDRIAARRHADRSSLALALIRRLSLEREQRPAEGDTPASLLELERHRVRKIKQKRIDNAVSMRTVATAAAGGQPNPVVFAFHQHKILAYETIDQLVSLATRPIAPLREDFLNDQQLTTNMHRSLSLEAETDSARDAKEALIKWIGFARRLETLIDDVNCSEEIIRSQTSRNVETDVILPRHTHICHAPQHAPLVSQSLSLARKNIARRRWQLVKVRAKQAYAKILADNPSRLQAAISALPRSHKEGKQGRTTSDSSRRILPAAP